MILSIESYQYYLWLQAVSIPYESYAVIRDQITCRWSHMTYGYKGCLYLYIFPHQEHLFIEWLQDGHVLCIDPLGWVRIPIIAQSGWSLF
jgi:hypothetical protein